MHHLESHSRSSEMVDVVDHVGHFLCMVCSINIAALRRFWNMTTSTVYMTACKLNKSFSLDKTLKITGHVCFLIHI